MAIIYKRMPVIYIAAPYTALSRMDVEYNIYRARKMGEFIARLGASPLIPHSNTAWMDGTPEFWYSATAELLRRSDAVLAYAGRGESAGVRGEVSLAKNLGMPCWLWDVLPEDVLFSAISRFIKKFEAKIGG